MFAWLCMKRERSFFFDFLPTTPSWTALGENPAADKGDWAMIHEVPSNLCVYCCVF